MNERDKSRQEWEQKIVRQQQMLTPADYPEGLHHVQVNGLPKINSQVRFWLGIVIVAAGVNLFRFSFSGATIVVVAALASGVVLTITAMR